MIKFLHSLRICRVLLRHQLDEFVLTGLPLRLNPYRWFSSQKHTPRGERLRLALESLGPIFVKFGQILSTRRDLLPDDLATHLALLQDQVPPFDGTLAQSIIEKQLGAPTQELFAEFSITPLASASIAQVHAAELHSGEKVVVKVLRPKIKRVIRRDIALMKGIAKLITRLWPDGRRLKPLDVVREFEVTLYDELDLLREAANASQLRRNFKGSNQLVVPEVFWPYCKRKVMVMERIYGIPVTDMATLKQKCVNLKQLAHYGVEVFFTQVFRDCFFHADMHAGNIFVDATDPNNPHYLAVDFGIVGTLTPEDQHYLAYNFIAFFRRDYRQVAALHIESGWVPKGTRLNEFESAIRTVCEPIFERPIKDISFGQLLLRLFQTARRFNMHIQPQLLLLQKTLLNIEGLGRQLYPDLNLWDTAKPFLEDWMKTQVGWQAINKNLKERGPFWLAHLAELPDHLHEHLLQQKRQTELMQAQLATTSELISSQRVMLRRQVVVELLVVVGLALLFLWLA